MSRIFTQNFDINQSKMIKRMIENVKKGMLITFLSSGMLFSQPQNALAMYLGPLPSNSAQEKIT